MNAKHDHAQDQRLIRGRMSSTALLFVLCLVASPPHVSAEEPVRPQAASIRKDCSTISPLDLGPVYRIPLRVHLAESDRSPAEFRKILEEINDIWLSQAGICFEMQAVLDDEPLDQGMDIWFLPALRGGPGLNGYFRNDHDIQVRDTPLLGPAPHPAHYPAARTAAHEFGHGLSLMHRQNSDDNLMRSKTHGWQLNGQEVFEARQAASKKALPDTSPRHCSEPRFILPHVSAQK